MFEAILNESIFFRKIASLEMKNIRIDEDGMREESFDMVRKDRANGRMRPIEVSIYPGESPVLIDGRHRLEIAREMGDPFIEALIRYYDSEGSVIAKKIINLTL